MNAYYVENVCTVIAPGMEYIWENGAADIQVPSPLGDKSKREGRHQDSGVFKRHYGSQVTKWEHHIGECQEILDNYPAKGVLW